MPELLFAYMLDALFGKPHWLLNPNEGIKWLINKAERFFKKRLKNLKLAGVFITFIVGGLIWLGVKFFVWDFGLIHPVFGALAVVVLLYLAISVKAQKEKINKIYGLLNNNQIDSAKEEISQFIDIDARQMDSEQLLRATVEYIASQITNGSIAVLFYAFVGGPVLAWIYKAINTLDLLLGYKKNNYKEIGWFAAKANDILTYIPSRVSGLVIPLASHISKKTFSNSLQTILKDGIKHPNPNIGIPQAGLAGALGVQLGGLSYYEGLPLHKPYIGQPVVKFQNEHIKEAVNILRISSTIMILAITVIYYIWNILL